jgi:hypothetical protein
MKFGRRINVKREESKRGSKKRKRGVCREKR